MKIADSNHFFDGGKIKFSEYPCAYIPARASIIIGVDYCDGIGSAVKGFYDTKTGEYHIQEYDVSRSVWLKNK